MRLANSLALGKRKGGRGLAGHWNQTGIRLDGKVKIDIDKRLWGPYAKAFNRAKGCLVRSHLADLDSVTILSALKVLKEEVLSNARKLFRPIPQGLQWLTNNGAYVEFSHNLPNWRGSVQKHYINLTGKDAAPKLVLLFAPEYCVSEPRLNRQ